MGPLENVFVRLGAVVLGQRAVAESLVVALLSDGHVLLEGPPGVAKTLAVRTLAELLDLQFSRVQFTPDLLPADVLGTAVYQQHSGEFRLKRGPVFTNLLLADEVNRAPAKVQAALLEAMAERQVTLNGESHRLPDPFMVLATQNPIEQEGTYPLPEAQLDRFLLKVRVPYPDRDSELAMVEVHGRIAAEKAVPAPSLTADDVRELRRKADAVHVDPRVAAHAVDLARATREPESFGLKDLAGLIELPASPRASLALVRAARAYALIAGRDYAVPSDVRRAALEVLRHRLGRSFEAEARGLTADDLVEILLRGLPAP